MVVSSRYSSGFSRLDRDEARLDRDTAERERDVIGDYAAVLQQLLLPPALPTITGLSLAVRYRPADPRQVGGDFYDVFPRRGPVGLFPG